LLRLEYGISKVVHCDPEIMGGEPVFKRTRVPVKSLFDHLAGGDSIEIFPDGFPSVTRKQVLTLLKESGDYALAQA
jgi:uncharacterized protein (DUF433 family)